MYSGIRPPKFPIIKFEEEPIREKDLRIPPKPDDVPSVALVILPLFDAATPWLNG